MLNVSNPGGGKAATDSEISRPVRPGSLRTGTDGKDGRQSSTVPGRQRAVTKYI